jgi:hypothetical protein
MGLERQEGNVRESMEMPYQITGILRKYEGAKIIIWMEGGIPRG